MGDRDGIVDQEPTGERAIGMTRDGRWIAIACTNDRMFERLGTGAMKRPELLADFGSVAARLRRRVEVDGLVQAWVGGHDAAEALARLEGAEVPASPVNSVRDLFEDPHMQASENIVSAISPLACSASSARSMRGL